MKRKRVQDYASQWEQNAQIDAMYAVLTVAEKQNRGRELEEFLSTGEDEIERLLSYMTENHISIDRTSTCLDFGCGIGRLSKPLTQIFDTVTGVDISATMIATARKIVPAARFIVNGGETLEGIEGSSIGFTYSNIVLQHLATRDSLGYIRDFGRVAKEGAGSFSGAHPSRWSFRIVALVTSSGQVASTGSLGPKEKSDRHGDVRAPSVTGDRGCRNRAGSSLNISPTPTRATVTLGAGWSS